MWGSAQADSCFRQCTSPDTARGGPHALLDLGDSLSRADSYSADWPQASTPQALAAPVSVQACFNSPGAGRIRHASERTTSLSRCTESYGLPLPPSGRFTWVAIFRYYTFGLCSERLFVLTLIHHSFLCLHYLFPQPTLD